MWYWQLQNQRYFKILNRTKNISNRRYPTETISGADHADYLALQENTSAQAESLLHCLIKGIDMYSNSDKTEFPWFNKDDDILGYRLISLSDKISSTKSYVCTLKNKIRTSTERLSTIRISYLSDKIKLKFFQTVAVPVVPLML